MAGGKGKSSGGKSSGGKTAVDGPKKQQSHSARAGLQVRYLFIHSSNLDLIHANFPSTTSYSITLSNNIHILRYPSPESCNRRACMRVIYTINLTEPDILSHCTTPTIISIPFWNVLQTMHLDMDISTSENYSRKNLRCSQCLPCSVV